MLMVYVFDDLYFVDLVVVQSESKKFPPPETFAYISACSYSLQMKIY